MVGSGVRGGAVVAAGVGDAVGEAVGVGELVGTAVVAVGDGDSVLAPVTHDVTARQDTMRIAIGRRTASSVATGSTRERVPDDEVPTPLPHWSSPAPQAGVKAR